MLPGDDRLLALVGTREVQAYANAPRTAVYVARRDGHILWASPAFEPLFGHRAPDLVGRNAWTIFPAKEDLPQAAESSALLSEGDMAVWLRLLKADGNRDWFRVDALNREGGVVLAFRRETDPAQQHFHSFRLPKPRRDAAKP